MPFFFLSFEIQGKQYAWSLNQGLECVVKELELKLKAVENHRRFVSGGVTQIYLFWEDEFWKKSLSIMREREP